MKKLFDRVQKNLDQDLPIDKIDIIELLMLARIASDILTRTVCSDSPFQAPSSK